MELKSVTVLLVVSLLYKQGLFFNLDVKYPIIYEGTTGSHYGYSLAFHKYKNQDHVLIGAPEDRARNGSVQMCPANGKTCISINPDRRAEWFGATVVSASGVPLICAPKTFFYQHTSLGACYFGSRNSTSVQPRFEGLINYAAVTGMSAAVTPEGDAFAVPVCKSWVSEFAARSGTGTYSTRSPPDGVTSNAYFGYSVTFAKFQQSVPYHLIVSSPRMERTNRRLGKTNPNPPSLVHVISPTGALLRNIPSSQTGEFFGYSIIAVDVNGDKRDEIFIGAPFYTDYGAQNQFEAGRVYVYEFERVSPDWTLRKPKILEVKSSKARFGTAIASLGDINGDSFQDVAVGAPYYKETGAVFVFLGSASGITEQASQIITPSDFQQNWKTFGYSLSGGADVDSNQYNDLLVGAYRSDRAVLLKSRPVAYLTPQTYLGFSQSQIDLQTKNCTLNNKVNVSCVTLKFCLEYTGLRDVNSSLRFKVDVSLDSKSIRFPRLAFVRAEGNSSLSQDLTSAKNRSQCHDFQVYVKPTIRDKLSPFEVTLALSLVEEGKQLSTVLDHKAIVRYSNSTAVQKDCGPDNICIPDLQLFVNRTPSEYIQGNRTRFQVNLTVANRGEDAYESQLFFVLPEELEYISTDYQLSEDILCSPPNRNNSQKVLVCDIGNPLPAGASVHLSVYVEPAITFYGANFIEFSAETNSTNREKPEDYRNNKIKQRIPLIVQTGGLLIAGISSPLNMQVNLSSTEMVEATGNRTVNRRVQHIFRIYNKGPSVILGANVEILWPSTTITGDPLMQITQQPVVKGPATCEPVRGIPSDDSKNNTDSNSQEGNQENERQPAPASQVLRTESSIPPTPITVINCTIGELTTKENVDITIYADININSVVQAASGIGNFTQCSSEMKVRITKLPLDEPVSGFKEETNRVSTSITFVRQISFVAAAPPWIMVASVGAGIVLLALVAFILHQFGFFKRNRPVDYKEDQPLTSNQEPQTEPDPKS